WHLWPRQDQFELRPLLHHPSLAKLVFFPDAEASVGIRQLWRWFRCGARSAWFLEGIRWKECDVLGLLTHRVVCKAARAFPSRLSRRLQQSRTRTRVMMTPMLLTRQFGPPSIVHAEVTSPQTNVWKHWIADGNEASLQAHGWQSVGSGSPLKIVQYLGA